MDDVLPQCDDLGQICSANGQADLGNGSGHLDVYLQLHTTISTAVSSAFVGQAT